MGISWNILLFGLEPVDSFSPSLRRLIEAHVGFPTWKMTDSCKNLEELTFSAIPWKNRL